MAKEEEKENNSKKNLVLKEIEFITLKHKFKMEELEYERETQRRFHENQMAYHRIKRADMNREFDRKESLR